MPDNTPFIVSAFAITWIAFLGYAFHLYRVRRDAERRLDDATNDAAGATTGRGGVR
jgi:CcmD family protein